MCVEKKALRGMVLNITKMDTNQPENDRSRSHGDFQRLVTL